VNAARAAMEQARMVAQESRVRREGLVEQFAATRFDLAEILAGLAADAAVPAWEESLTGARADLEKLGQVNLAAIDELKRKGPGIKREISLWGQVGEGALAIGCIAMAVAGQVEFGIPCVVGGVATSAALRIWDSPK